MSAAFRNVFTPYSAGRKVSKGLVSSQPGQRALLLFPQTEHIAVGAPLASHVCVSGYFHFCVGLDLDTTGAHRGIRLLGPYKPAGAWTCELWAFSS